MFISQHPLHLDDVEPLPELAAHLTLGTDEREAARDWLLDQAGTVRTAFNELADKLQVGYDDEAWPCQFNVSQAPAGVSMKIVCSAIRGLEPGEVAEVLRKTGKNWKKLLQRLELAEVMS